MKRGKKAPEEAPEDADESEAAPSKRGEEEGSEAPSEPSMPFMTRLRRGLRTFRFPIALAVLVAGTVLFFLGLLAYTPVGQSGPLVGLEQSLLGAGCNAPGCTNTGPNWALPSGLVGALMALIGAYLAGVYIVARRRFEHLMKTKSKAEFLRNITEAEDLLWDLTPEDEIRLVRKKLELKIRG